MLFRFSPARRTFFFFAFNEHQQKGRSQKAAGDENRTLVKDGRKPRGQDCSDKKACRDGQDIEAFMKLFRISAFSPHIKEFGGTAQISRTEGRRQRGAPEFFEASVLQGAYKGDHEGDGRVPGT